MEKIAQACLIGDDPVHIFLSTKYLKLSGMVENITVFNNGKEAFDKLKILLDSGESMPEVILLDLNMPVWDGWKFLENFSTLQLKKKVTIFILTSSINAADRKRAETYEKVQNFIVKPISLDDFKELLKNVK